MGFPIDGFANILGKGYQSANNALEIIILFVNAKKYLFRGYILGVLKDTAT